MKVALLTNFIPPYRVSLYKAVSDKVENFHVFVCTEMEKNRSWKVDVGDLNVTIQKNISYFKTTENGYKTYVHFPYDTIFKLIKYNPDVVISAELGFRSLFSTVYCKLFNRPLILWLALSQHTERNKKGLRITVRKFLLKNSSAILCNGKSSKDYVKSLGVNKKVFYIPCTSDYRIGLPKSSFNKEVKKVLYTGDLIKRKGIEEMVNSFVKWSIRYPNESIDLIIAGDGVEKIQFEKIDSYPNINCQLLGRVAYEKLQELYLEVDLYLFPTLEDEWGVVVNEAFASGIPVIGSIYSQAVMELVEDEVTGWKYDPLIEDNFISTFQKALQTDTQKLQKMSSKCLEAIDKITPEKVGGNIMKAIHHAAKTD